MANSTVSTTRPLFNFCFFFLEFYNVFSSYLIYLCHFFRCAPGNSFYLFLIWMCARSQNVMSDVY